MSRNHDMLQSTPIEVIDLSTDSEEEEEEIVVQDSDPLPPVIPQTEPEDPRLSYMKCVICLDSPTNLTATPCGHLFCHECLTSALTVTSATSGNCPVCRRKITLKSLIPLSILRAPVLGADLPLPHEAITAVGVPTMQDDTSKAAKTATSNRSSRRKRSAAA